MNDAGNSLVYNLGPNKDYILSKNALQHIINGDISDRQDRIGNTTVLTKILAGGLHTFAGWESFISYRPDIKHGLFFNELSIEDWYFIRELKNGTMLLKLPRSAFQNKAARLTKLADGYNMSGYLWKTLFPKEFSEADIIRSIDEALENQDATETSSQAIIGYTKSDDPFKVLKIRIQLIGKNIQSAFPTWTQPMTGNDGKPFSPSEALRLIVASSTVLTQEDRIRLENLQFSYNKESFTDLLNVTPLFILARPRPDMTKQRVRKRIVRDRELGEIAAALTNEEINKALDLALSDNYLRYPQLFMRTIYDEYYIDIIKNQRAKNAICIYENLREILIVLSNRDKSDGMHRAFDVIKRFLKVHFLFTGGMDQWESKRLSNVMIDIVIEYNDEAVTLEFLTLLNESPVRIAVFTEFNTYTLFNPKLEITGLTGIPEPLYLNHFYEFVVQQLGSNYTLSFDSTFNRNKAIEAQHNVARYGIELVQDQVMHSIASDFSFFSERFTALCKTIMFNGERLKLIHEILLTYKRVLAVNVQRILIKYKDLFSKKEEEYEFLSPKFIEFTHAKHEHHFLRRMMDVMLEDLAKIFLEQGFAEEANTLWEKYGKVLAEVVNLPIPKSVPTGLNGAATPEDFPDEQPPPEGIERPYKIKLD